MGPWLHVTAIYPPDYVAADALDLQQLLSLCSPAHPQAAHRIAGFSQNQGSLRAGHCSGLCLWCPTSGTHCPILHQQTRATELTSTGTHRFWLSPAAPPAWARAQEPDCLPGQCTVKPHRDSPPKLGKTSNPACNQCQKHPSE